MRTFWYIALLYAMLGLLNIARKWPFLIDAKEIAIFCNIRQTKQCIQKCNIPKCAHEKILKIFIKKLNAKNQWFWIY